MLSDEDLVNLAFEKLGSVLEFSDTPKEYVTKVMSSEYGLDTDIAAEIVEVAFERWVEIYCPD